MNIGNWEKENKNQTNNHFEYPHPGCFFLGWPGLTSLFLPRSNLSTIRLDELHCTVGGGGGGRDVLNVTTTHGLRGLGVRVDPRSVVPDGPLPRPRQHCTRREGEEEGPRGEGERHLT